MNQTGTKERVIERNFFREDFRHAFLQEIGLIGSASAPVQEYAQGFLQHVDSRRICARRNSKLWWITPTA